MRAALLCHGHLGPFSSKTAVGILRYGTRHDVVAVIDREKAGRDTGEFLDGLGAGVPIVASMEEAIALGAEALVLGIAPIGGRFPPAWRSDILAALVAGLEVQSGLHTFLSEDAEFAAVAERTGARLWDVRRPERPERVATGEGRRVDALVVHTMGTDCRGGKMTTAAELVREARRRGVNAAFAATGQTGILIGCDAGAPIDRVVSDFVAGAAEELVLQCADSELVVVEGQGSLSHPAYSGVTLGLMHGCFPDLVILCHVATRTHHHEYESPPDDFPLWPLSEHVHLIDALLRRHTGGRVAALSLATQGMDEAAAREALQQAAKETGLPAFDPVRFGAGGLLEAVLAAATDSQKPGARRCASTVSV